MVARITTPHRITDALNYNEQKVQRGAAECIYAGNYLNKVQSMNFYQKLEGFEHRNMLNDRALTKTLHVSLNFDPSEKLPTERLIHIASLYMQKIGFGEQPYLVYRHLDAGHPHLHIVSTIIREDGSRINTHNMGRNQSETARKEIELECNLLRAAAQQQRLPSYLTPVAITKVQYGKEESKRSISRVVTAVVNSYTLTSLAELNAALRQFNVVADSGSEESRIYKHRGLVYRILDEKGNKIGVPIKASSINGKPTLDTLEKKFALHAPARELFKQSLKNTLDAALTTAPTTMNQFIATLQHKQVCTLLRKNKEGFLYGIIFVDNQNKCVFNGSDLGKGYSAASLQSRIGMEEGFEKEKTVADETKEKTVLSSFSNASSKNQHKKVAIQEQKEQSSYLPLTKDKVGDALLFPHQRQEQLPSGLLPKKKKQKKNHLGL